MYPLWGVLQVESLPTRVTPGHKRPHRERCQIECTFSGLKKWMGREFRLRRCLTTLTKLISSRLVTLLTRWFRHGPTSGSDSINSSQFQATFPALQYTNSSHTQRILLPFFEFNGNQAKFFYGKRRIENVWKYWKK